MAVLEAAEALLSCGVLSEDVFVGADVPADAFVAFAPFASGVSVVLAGDVVAAAPCAPPGGVALTALETAAVPSGVCDVVACCLEPRWRERAFPAGTDVVPADAWELMPEAAPAFCDVPALEDRGPY